MVFWLVTGTVVLLIAGLVRGRATRHLTPEQANQVATVFAMRRLIRVFGQLYFMFLLVLWYVLPVDLPAWSGWPAVTVGLVAVAWSHVSLVRRFRALALPAGFISQFNRSRFIIYIGLLLAASPTIYEATCS
jgi:hypothetical protein